MVATPELPMLARDAWRAGHGTPRAFADRQRARLRDLLAHARARSPFYRRLYRDLPSDHADPAALPPVTKRQLMDAFDEVVTDPAVTRARVEAFLSDPTLVGRPFLGRYRLWRSSGVTGEPGMFVQDERALRVYRTLSLVRGWLPWMTPGRLAGALRRGDRVAAVLAVGEHFVSSCMMQEHRRHRPRPFDRIRVFPIQDPLPELVRGLNAFQPAELVGYPSALALLAREQLTGRLAIRPVLIGSGSEWLGPEQRHLIESAFGCAVRENYSASECTRMVWDCRRGRLHVGADWLILEPVDEQLRPVEPGRLSHTTLITNLANRVQPLIRYDLGDRVARYPEPCPCGSPLPAIRVEGRRDDVLVVRSGDGRDVRLLPIALWAALQGAPGVRRFQLIQTGPAALSLRLEVEPGADPARAWDLALGRLRGYLTAQAVPEVAVERSPESPRSDPRTGKYRYVWSELPAEPRP